LEKFGIVPEFKTGFHCGEVTIGEVGVIKREIVFTGDVLNTAARIQELCNTYNVKLLVSKKLLDLLPIENRYLPKAIGEITLRGKQTADVLYNLERIEYYK
jgi:adenylate cyclase